MTDSWIIKYRPAKFDEVVGHDIAVKALEASVNKGNSSAYLFTGPSGVGKTTLARITANELGCDEVIEIDAATNTGIDAMRDVTSNLSYRPLGGGKKALIVDESHALSKAASQSLLKILEEPPDWVYWFLCTTEGTRLLPTLRTRCLHIDLKPVAKRDLIELLSFVAAKEQVSKKLIADGKVLAMIAQEARGSPRQAIAYLSAASAAEDYDEACDIVGSAEGSPEAFDLAKLFITGGRWAEAQELLGRMDNLDPESVRYVVLGYFNKVAINAKEEKKAGRAIEIIDAFSQPFYHRGHLTLAVGKLLLS